MKRVPDYLKNRIKDLPSRPGVYLFKGREGRTLYIGKAVSIRRRVAGHFRSFGETFSKEGVMLEQVSGIDCIETLSEAEALLLESSLIKEALPKYNQELRDDKSYPYLKITAEEYPRLLIVRGRKADGGKYFGPYTSAPLLRQAVRMLRRQFPMRTCKKMPKKVCLLYHLGQCGGPCEGHEDQTAYRQTVSELGRFLEGRRDALVKHLSKRMKAHSEKREYERAQALYEEIRALASVMVSGPQKEGAELLGEMQKALMLPRTPRRLECFDISNIQGREAVGSMVVFVDGRPHRAGYRRFRIRTVTGIDDYQMMREVVRRRYGKALAGKQTLPDLVVIDGGKGHLSAAKAELERLGLQDLPMISIAKQHEHLFSPEREGPHIFSAASPVLGLIRYLRDEAHRFAITYHRRLHKTEALISRLDEVPGVGPKTRQKLLARIGSPTKIRTLSEGELAERGHLDRKTARRVLEFLNRPAE